jgi:hypothetical protein
MLNFFLRQKPVQPDTPHTEYQDPYLEQVVSQLRLLVEQNTVKITQSQQTKKEVE